MRATSLSCLFFVALGCGDGAAAEPATEPTPETSESPVSPESHETSPPEVETAYAIHEWGFIAHQYADDENRSLNSGAPLWRTTPPAAAVASP